MFSFSQNKIVVLHDSLKTNYLRLDTYKWSFHTGDNISWAKPDIDDTQWDTVITNFADKNKPKNWTGFGWFRLHIKKSSQNSINTFGLYINHDAASEVYFDGNKIMSLGKLGHSRQTSVAVRNPYLTIPLAITDTMPHLISIRFSNFFNYFPNFFGFNASISDLHYMNQTQKADQRFFDFLLMSAAAMAILILLHILLYVFYPKQKVNLYYSLFVTTTLMAIVARYLTIVTTNPAIQVIAYKVFLSGILFIPLTGWLLLYNVANKRFTRWKLNIILLESFALYAYYLINWHNDPESLSKKPYDLILNGFCLLVFADGAITVIKAIKKGNKKLWLIAIGMIVLALASVIAGSNMLGLFKFQQVMVIMAYSCLLMPVLFSIYIAIDVASNNRKLANQLVENERLSAENLSKEQEKNKLILGQAEELERTVLERTKQLREQAAKLQEMDAAKSRFFVNLTHEFKTPLTLIINPAKELLLQPNAAAAKKYAQYILQNSERLLQLINQLLDLSRLESGLMEINYNNVDIVKWLQVHLHQFASLAEHDNIKLSFETDTTSLWVKTDVDKLEKIVQNLISNAIKFSNKNGEVTVLFKHKNGDDFKIIVKDEGIGISKEKLLYIFDRFYQADASDTRTREGTGIGLALVKELTGLLDGTINVTSIENAGTSFNVTLPYIFPDQGDDKEQNLFQEDHLAGIILLEAGATTVLAEQENSILIVEDNEQLREFIKISLQENYNVTMAKNGAEGIDVAIATIPNLVITDLMMPEKNGYELCEVLKKDERTSHIPIIMLTAKTDRNSKIQGIETGADAYLSKPFDKQELLAQILNLIKNRKQLREKYGRNNYWLYDAVDLPSIEQTFLTRVKEAIHTRIDDVQFGAEALGKEVFLSRTQLHRKLKDLIDQSPGELIRSIRMQKAHELLQKNVATVAEVSYMVGYGNPANFSTSFTKHFGYPPSAASFQNIK
ncbi:ATP-binding protein [Ferruginibacter sp.]|uniref:ATP-binding protein n=1 Tax=Ferruginibacter sp. TaxID=1940288 RepID=UPI0019B1CD45|nr:ATP-binding protein [Ferruginibacter sp.]MBC7626815.1 response regulator [Ferruginibacter sp.]